MNVICSLFIPPNPSLIYSSLHPPIYWIILHQEFIIARMCNSHIVLYSKSFNHLFIHASAHHLLNHSSPRVSMSFFRLVMGLSFFGTMNSSSGDWKASCFVQTLDIAFLSTYSEPQFRVSSFTICIGCWHSNQQWICLPGEAILGASIHTSYENHSSKSIALNPGFPFQILSHSFGENLQSYERPSPQWKPGFEASKKLASLLLFFH